MAGNCYSIKKNRIQQGFYPGFALTEEGRLETLEGETQHYLYLRAIDSAENDSEWGRLCFRAELPESMACYVYVVALNEDSFYRNGEPVKIENFLCNKEESGEIKRLFMERAGAQRFVNQQDSLLYKMKGRYLYLIMELSGEGKASVSGMRVEQQGDNFMATFPEIYQEKGGFFHRYLSIFSSLYNDFQMDIEQAAELLNLDTCPKELLPLYGSWLGIDVSADFMEEEWLRLLVKEAYHLNRMKGTRWAVQRIAEIVLGETVTILEQNVMKDYVEDEEYERFARLYGKGIYDVTILVKRYVPETLKSRLLFLLNQFRPIRSRIHIVYLKESGMLDSHCYLDMNAQMLHEEKGTLDMNQSLDDIIILQ